MKIELSQFEKLLQTKLNELSQKEMAELARFIGMEIIQYEKKGELLLLTIQQDDKKAFVDYDKMMKIGKRRGYNEEENMSYQTIFGGQHTFIDMIIVLEFIVFKSSTIQPFRDKFKQYTDEEYSEILSILNNYRFKE